MLQRLAAAPGRLGRAVDREALTTAGNRHVERRLDLAQVFVEHPTEVGQTIVVDRRQQQLDRPLLCGCLSFHG